MTDPNRERTKIHPALQSKLERLEAVMRIVGHEVFLTEGWRSNERQEELYAIGRTVKVDQPTVTDARAGESMHNHGLAADYAFRKQPIYSEEHPWDYFGTTAKMLGLEWGGDWESRDDRPHVELHLAPVAGES